VRTFLWEENLDFKRLSILLIWLGAMFLLAGAFSWGARTPEETWLKEGYYHCLWASSYRVTSEIKPDFLNPRWNADKASCAPPEQTPSLTLRKMKREKLRA
jgi:hypothetical protein